MNTITDDAGMRPLDVVYKCYTCKQDFVLHNEEKGDLYVIAVELPLSRGQILSQLCPECAVKAKVQS